MRVRLVSIATARIYFRGHARDLLTWIPCRGSLDIPVRVHKAHSRFEPVDMRLVIIKKPPAAATQARVKARRASRKNQRRTDPRTLAGADYAILLTSLKREEFPIDLVGALYRLRWQIELAFKRLKSILHIDRLPAKHPDLVRAWLYAHLLLALLLDDITAELGAISPSATEFATNVALALDDPPRRRGARRHLAAA
jgi:IS4 transposase